MKTWQQYLESLSLKDMQLIQQQQQQQQFTPPKLSNIEQDIVYLSKVARHMLTPNASKLIWGVVDQLKQSSS